MFTSTFTGKEIVKMYDQYFYQHAWESTYFELESRCTHHMWLIVKESSELQDSKPNIRLYHKYNRRLPYHLQCGCYSVESAIKKIKSHDSYVLKKQSSQLY